MKWLKNVKPSYKSCFSPQELQNLSRDTHMKRINPQQLPNLTQDTNMKRLNYVKLASQSGFRPHELPKLSQDTIASILFLNLFKRWVLSLCAALEWSQSYMPSRMHAITQDHKPPDYFATSGHDEVSEACSHCLQPLLAFKQALLAAM